jgi:hydrogenase/urease accessory protein HupE
MAGSEPIVSAVHLLCRIGGAMLMSIAVLVATPSAGHGHGLDPAALALRETAAGIFDVHWRASALRLPGADVQPVLPMRCRPTSAKRDDGDTDHIALRWTVNCGAAGLEGEEIRIDDLAAAKINALVTITRLDGVEIQTVLGPRQPPFRVPAQPVWSDVAWRYVALGIEHILTGPDHLLFVLGLVLLVSGSRLLVRTITAFTLGHSVTLSAAVLHLTNVPSRPIEALIALSVLVLAVELARDVRSPTLLRRFPWAMAATFGLLHGFGFAGALAEAGLPPGDVPLALVSFNAGIEIGQLAFVGAMLLAGALLRRRLPRLASRAVPAVVYTMGILAAFWWLERMAAWLA